MKLLLFLSTLLILPSMFDVRCSAFDVLAGSPAKPYGAGTITRTSDGKTHTTTRYGHGTITRSSDGKTATTTRYGHGTITRSSDGRTAITLPYGKVERRTSNVQRRTSK